ncbi:hypothetical protein Tsubulata_006734, partial [Turnera subulata]
MHAFSWCIPYKFNVEEDGKNPVVDRVLVLMISSPNREDLVFPKGGWENDETLNEAACREAMEEAGVRGILGEEPLGVWEFRSKSSETSCSPGRGCRGYMFALEVTEELEQWPGLTNYNRKWLTIEEAFNRSRYEWMRDALTKFLEVVSNSRKQETRPELLQLEVIPVLDMGTEGQMLSTSCHGTQSGVQDLEESSAQ